MPTINYADDSQRTVIVGATGSGKTHAALFHLCRRSYTSMPWFVYDFKYDKFINEIPGAQHITIEDPLPVNPGLYVVHPDVDDELAVSLHMRKIWEQENIGVFVDEGYMIGTNNKGFRSLLTQGRSKRVPMIVLSQRPVWMDRFVFSEADFIHMFRLQNSQDIQKVEEYVPHDLGGKGTMEQRRSKRLKPRHSYYYDVANDELARLGPLPDRNAILSMFDARLSRIKKVV